MNEIMKAKHGALVPQESTMESSAGAMGEDKLVKAASKPVRSIGAGDAQPEDREP